MRITTFEGSHRPANSLTVVRKWHGADGHFLEKKTQTRECAFGPLPTMQIERGFIDNEYQDGEIRGCNFL